MPAQNPFSTLLVLAVWMFLNHSRHAGAFTASPKPARTTCLAKTATALSYKNNNDNDKHGNNNDDDGSSFTDPSWQVLNQRLQQMRLDVLEQELQRPPHPRLSATDFVQRLLEGILHNADPLPEAGFRLLLRTATAEWKAALYQAVGAPLSAPEDAVASALGQAMGRPDNQYAILVGGGDGGLDCDDEPDDNKPEQARVEYVPTFPAEPLDYYDGTAWVECRLRDKRDNSLLVSTGWQLRRNPEGAWMVEGIDWQDFRDQFRPGIGREEWMRICY